MGYFSKEIYELVRPSRLYLIDFWHPNYKLTMNLPSGDKDNLVWKPRAFTGAECYPVVLEKFSHLKEVVILRGISHHVLSTLPPKHLDAVYVDADHSYQGCLNDLEYSLPKIKSGGYIMGHDYCETLMPVVKAVDFFCKKHNLKIDYLTDEPLLPVPYLGGIGKKEEAFNSYAIQVP